MWKTIRFPAYDNRPCRRSEGGENTSAEVLDPQDEPQPEPNMRAHRLRRALYTTLQLGLVLIGLWGCSLMQSNQEIPGYLVIAGFGFAPQEDQGTGSTNITDVWVYSTTDVIGVFPLPAVVPVLPQDAAEGPVTLLAGIRESGISNSRAPYPFYTVVEHFPTEGPGRRDTLTPEIELVEGVRLLPVEDFENSNVFGNVGSGEGMVRTDIPDAVFEGEYAGVLQVNADAPLARVRTVEQEYSLQSGAPAFMELDYRCDQSFAVGLMGYRDGIESKHLALVINATGAPGAVAEWNKLYVDLAPALNAQGTADHFEVYFECILEADRAAGTVGLDNVRILTY